MATDPDLLLEQLYAGQYRRLVRLAVLVLGDQASAEEIVQDSFVAVHPKLARLSDPEKAAAYLRTTVLNRCRSALRRRAVALRHVPSPAPPIPGADADALIAERRRQVLAALQQLPTRQREVLALRYYLDLDEATIADWLGISRGSVKSHASRGAAALRTLMEETR